MSLLYVRNLSFTHGGPLLFDQINFTVESGERIGLVGRNGTGKSTLLKLLCGEFSPDDGSIVMDETVTIGRLIQEVPDESHLDVAGIVRQGLNINASVQDLPDWEHQQKVDRVLSRLDLQAEAPFASLSSGMKRRVLLAQTLVSDPDILLLDEPTNHLDVDSIAWLERFLSGYSGAIIFVTHDRVFLQRLAVRIMEIDRAGLFDWTCDYNTFLLRRQEFLDAETKQNAAFDRRLAEEEVWIRKGIKARRTRNEGRVRALKKMREEHSQRRIRIGKVRMQAADAERSGQLVLEAKQITFAWQGHPVVTGFSTSVSRGDRVGIIGPNGAGKTTLIKILLGELTPCSGSVRTGTNLQIIYFDQLRESIDETKTVVENVGEGQDTLLINGRSRHIYGYLQDFLFTPERARRPARYLSGGEQNRLMLAKLFRQPSNVMVLDEPTNDLDAETLELLEELVSQYAGTVLLISHDRAFLNNVVTSTIAFEPDGVVREYDGGYDDYLRQRPESVSEPAEKAEIPSEQTSRDSPKKTKLSYKEQRELDDLPDQITALEDQQSQLHEQMADPEFYRQDSSVIAEATASLQSLTKQLETACDRWEELEELQNS
ncbi:MAG: ATP-binding cassette domain-containing protein [Fuerstiella sp.]|nr:ATP-binding cassette domain-containing protein [Fuerstiella sp.]